MTNKKPEQIIEKYYRNSEAHYHSNMMKKTKEEDAHHNEKA